MNQTDPSLDLEARRKRLRFQCWHRGFREIDLILGNFADTHLAKLTEDEITDIESLLSEPDQDIYEWLTGKQPVPATFDTTVFGRIRSLDFMSDSIGHKR